MPGSFRRMVSLDSSTLYAVNDPRWAALSSMAADVDIRERTAPDDVIEAVGDADAVLTNKTPVTAASIAACPHIRYIGVLATGYNIVDTEAARHAGITVCNVPAYSTSSVAQTAVSLLLALVQSVEEYAHANRGGRWSHCGDFTYRLRPWHELAGKVMGIIGFGNTGRATAAIAAALGMKILLLTSKPQSVLPHGYSKGTAEQIFRTADVVSLHCPLTPQTRNMINADTLASMKDGALLINTARGSLVDENALADALRSGHLGGAGLDVMCDEPPQADNPLLSAPRCIITPHIAWSSTEARERLFNISVDNLRAYLAGTPINVVC